MTFEWFVSLRYLRAKRKQTFISVISFISIAGVALGVAALILVMSVMTGFHDGVRQQILGNVPHVLVQNYTGGIKDYKAVAEKARTLPQVVGVAPYVAREAMILSQGNVAAANVKGVLSDHKIFGQSFLTVDKKPVADLLYDEKASLPGIVLAMPTATNLGVAVGDKVNVIPPMFTITPFGMIPKMKPFRVIAISESQSSFVDSYYAYIGFSQAQDFFDSKGEASGIEVNVDDFDSSLAVADALRNEYPFPFSVRAWQDLFGSFLAALKLEKLGLFIVLGIIVLVAAFNIATTLIMVVMEKHKDIAILRSMGATSRSVMKIFVLEGFIIGTLGTAIGTTCGVLLATNADGLIKWLERTFSIKIFDRAVYGMDHFPSVTRPEDVVIIAVVAMIISLLATLYPAWRAAKMDPAEALRYE